VMAYRTNNVKAETSLLSQRYRGLIQRLSSCFQSFLQLSPHITISQFSFLGHKYFH